MLKIRLSATPEHSFWAMEKTFTIGRASANHLSLDDESVDDKHAKIIQHDEHFILKDLGSHLGTFVNNTRITQKNISCGDTIQIGSVSLEVVDPFAEIESKNYWSLIADSSWLTGQEFPLYFSQKQPCVTLGRTKDCDIVIPSTHLSRRHAEITEHDGSLVINDLNSSNGTYVNDHKITQSSLRAGDKIRLDVYSFRVFGPGIVLPRAATQIMKALDANLFNEERAPEEILWQTRSTSPGNRTQEDLYKKNWWPQIVAVGIFIAFCSTLYLLLFPQD